MYRVRTVSRSTRFCQNLESHREDRSRSPEAGGGGGRKKNESRFFFLFLIFFLDVDTRVSEIETLQTYARVHRVRRRSGRSGTRDRRSRPQYGPSTIVAAIRWSTPVITVRYSFDAPESPEEISVFEHSNYCFPLITGPTVVVVVVVCHVISIFAVE